MPKAAALLVKSACCSETRPPARRAASPLSIGLARKGSRATCHYYSAIDIPIDPSLQVWNGSCAPGSDYSIEARGLPAGAELVLDAAWPEEYDRSLYHASPLVLRQRFALRGLAASVDVELPAPAASKSPPERTDPQGLAMAAAASLLLDAVEHRLCGRALAVDGVGQGAQKA